MVDSGVCGIIDPQDQISYLKWPMCTPNWRGWCAVAEAGGFFTMPGNLMYLQNGGERISTCFSWKHSKKCVRHSVVSWMLCNFLLLLDLLRTTDMLGLLVVALYHSLADMFQVMILNEEYGNYHECGCLWLVLY